MEERDGRLVTMTEIAELAGVRRPSVSTWRRRHASFPAPKVADDQQPLFDAGEVALWLDGRPLPDARPDLRVKTYGDRFRNGLRLSTLATLRGMLPGDRLLAAGLALTVLRHVSGRPLVDSPPLVLRLARETEERRPDLTGVLVPDITSLHSETAPLIRTVEEMCAAAGTTATAERLLAEADRLGAGLRAEATPEPIMDVVAELAGDVSDRAVYDPAVGAGSLLLRVLGQGRPRRVAAADLSRARLRMLRQRLALHGLSVDTVRQDSLASGQWFGADLVVADPPFTAGDKDTNAAKSMISWLRYSLAQAVPGGLAIVVVPAWVLTRVGDHDPVALGRARLVRQGTVAAVIQLPRRIHSFRTGTELAVIVLQRPAERGWRNVLLCNADRPEITLKETARWVRTWLTDRVSPQRPGIADAVPGDEFDRHRSLLPSHVLTSAQTPESYLTAIAAGRRRLGELTVTAPPDLPPVRAARNQARASVEKLTRDGRLRVFPGRRITSDVVGEAGCRVIGPNELLGSVPMGRRRVREEELSHRDRLMLTEPGDVIVLPADPPRALVDDEGHALVQAPAQVIRIVNAQKPPAEPWMTPRVLAALLTAPRNAERATGSLVRRVRLAGLELPGLDFDEVRRLDTALRTLDRLRNNAAEQLATLDNLTGAIVAGVADGLVSVAGDTPEQSLDNEHTEGHPRGTT